MLEEYLNKADNDIKYIKMYFGELKTSFAKLNDTTTDPISLAIAKDKITQCLAKIENILG